MSINHNSSQTTPPPRRPQSVLERLRAPMSVTRSPTSVTSTPGFMPSPATGAKQAHSAIPGTHVIVLSTARPEDPLKHLVGKAGIITQRKFEPGSNEREVRIDNALFTIPDDRLRITGFGETLSVPYSPENHAAFAFAASLVEKPHLAQMIGMQDLSLGALAKHNPSVPADESKQAATPSPYTSDIDGEGDVDGQGIADEDDSANEEDEEEDAEDAEEEDDAHEAELAEPPTKRHKPVKLLVGQHVYITAGRFQHETGEILRGGNGYYSIRLSRGRGPNDVISKRANELVVMDDSSPSTVKARIHKAAKTRPTQAQRARGTSQADKFHDKKVFVTVGKHRGQKGRVVSSGHGFYVVELSNGDECSLRASEMQIIDGMERKRKRSKKRSGSSGKTSENMMEAAKILTEIRESPSLSPMRSPAQRQTALSILSESSIKYDPSRFTSREGVPALPPHLNI